MDPRILVLNSGSSSVKYRLFERQTSGRLFVLVSGLVERIGEADSQAENHQAALDFLVEGLEAGGIFPLTVSWRSVIVWSMGVKPFIRR